MLVVWVSGCLGSWEWIVGLGWMSLGEVGRQYKAGKKR